MGEKIAAIGMQCLTPVILGRKMIIEDNYIARQARHGKRRNDNCKAQHAKIINLHTDIILFSASS